jgi:hypothetical protein
MVLNRSKAVALLLLGTGILCASNFAAHRTVAAAAAGEHAGKNTHPFLDKALKAVGGEEKLAKFHAGSCKGKLSGKVEGQELSLDGKVFWQGLDRFRLEADVKVGGQDMKVVVILNGDKAYFKANDKLEDGPGDAGPLIKEMTYCMRLPQLLGLLKDKGFKLSSVQETTVDDRAAVGLWIVHEDHKDAGLYFDKENGLPVKTETKLSDPQGKEVNFEFFYSDFKDVDGVKHPSKIRIKAPLGQQASEMELELTEIKTADKLDEKLFDKP